MPTNRDHFHTHDNFEIAVKIIDQVSVLKQHNAELEAELAALKAENERLKADNKKLNDIICTNDLWKVFAKYNKHTLHTLYTSQALRAVAEQSHENFERYIDLVQNLHPGKGQTASHDNFLKWCTRWIRVEKLYRKKANEFKEGK